MQNKKFSKILSIFSAAALLVTQLAVTLPASAAEEDIAAATSSTVTFTDDFESRDTLITEATAGVSIQDGKGKNGGKALVFDLANKAGTMNLVPQDAEGNRLAINAGESYKFIVTITYRMTEVNNLYAPIWMKHQLVNSGNGWLSGFAGNFHLGDVIWANRVPYSTYLGGYCGPTDDRGWHTVSYPISGTGAGSTGYLVHYFDGLGNKGELIIDDIKYTRVDNSSELSTVKLNANGGSTMDYITVLTGASTSELPTPAKSGYEFAGWYTDEACTAKCDTVPANNQSQTEDGKTTENVYVNLYAKWAFAPYVALYDDFESGNLITEATAGLSIQDGKGKNGGKALVFDLANKAGTMNLVPQDADGNRLAINAGESYKFIVTITYRMTEVNNLYAPIWMKHQLVNSGNGWLAGFAGNFHLGDVIWANRVPYSTYLGGYCGPTDDRGWHTVSYPISGTGAGSTGYLVHYFDGLGNKGELIIDDIKYTRVDNSSELSTVKLNANGGSTMDYITVVTGTSTSELPTPTKEGYKFAGWYTDEACTAKCDTVPANNQSQTEDGKTTENVYANLYAKWIIDYYVALYDDFESGNLITEATAGVSIQDGKGKNGGKALVFDLANKSGTMNLVPQDADGNRLAINAGESYKFIVTITYRMTEVNNQYSPIWMKSQLVNSSNGWLSGFAGNFHLGDCIWASRVPYSTGLGGYCGPTSDGKWHTVSFPISGTGHSSTNGYLVHYFDGLGNIGELVIDDIKYTRVDNSSELSTVKLNANGGSTMDYITVLTGASTSELPTPTKEGYEFAGWYTDEACTVKCDAVPSNNQSQTENDKTTENVYVNLYAKWTAVSFDANGDGSINIIDLVSMKKSIANNEVKYNSDSLVELKKVLLSGIETVKATDKNNYVLTVHDEFDGIALNTDLWNVTGDKNDVTLENGLAVFGNKGTAGSIDSANKVEYKYGYIEARVKLPETSGVESAFWLNQNYAPTLRFSEIDIFETFGRSQVVSNIHKWDNNNKKDSYATKEEELAFHTDWNANVLTLADRLARIKSVDTSAFHTVGCEWGEDFVRFYLDGEKYFEVNAEKYPAAIEIIKASPLYIVLSANPESATLTGTSADLMQVDYVRLYQNAAESTLIK